MAQEPRRRFEKLVYIDFNILVEYCYNLVALDSRVVFEIYY